MSNYYNRNIVKLSLSVLKFPMAGNGYKYFVQTDHSAHVAFVTFAGLSKWMAERGINFSQELPEAGEHHYQPLVGVYSEVSHNSYDEFFALEGHHTKVMSNSDYTLAIITADADGYRVVHYMNPNCKHRPVYDYQASRKEMS